MVQPHPTVPGAYETVAGHRRVDVGWLLAREGRGDKLLRGHNADPEPCLGVVVRQKIIATARPGSRVWYIEVPADDAPERAEAAGAEQTPDAAERRLPATDLGAASTIAPTAALKLADWSGILPGVSVRELERAIKAEALSAKAKGDGRDWAALAITGQAMVDYLATFDFSRE